MKPDPMYYLMTIVITFTIAVIAQFSADSVRSWRAHRIAHYISVGHNVVVILMMLAVMIFPGNRDDLSVRLGMATLFSMLIMWRFWFAPIVIMLVIVLLFE